MVSFSASGESLNQSLLWAYESNPEIKSARAGVRSTFEQIELAKSGLRPKYNLSGSYGATNTGLSSIDLSQSLSASFSASLLLWDGGQTDAAIESAKASVRAAEHNLSSFEQKILLQVVSAYLNILRDQKILKLQVSNVALLNKQVQSATVAFEEGAASLAEISAQKAAAASALAKEALAVANLETSKQAYKALTGHDAGTLEDVGTPRLPANGEAAKEQALKGHPTLMAALELERQAMFNLRQSQREYSPSVSLTGGLTATDALEGDGVSTSANVGITANMPLSTGGKTPALERQAQAILEKTAQENNAAKLEVAQSVLTAWANYVSAQATVGANNSVVAARRVANESSAIEFELGASTIIDKLKSDQDLLDSNVSLTTSKYNQVLSAFNVLGAMGKLDPENLGIGNNFDAVPAAAVVAVPVTEAQQSVDKILDRWVRP